MTAFDLDVLIRASPCNLVQPHPRLLNGQQKGQREFCGSSSGTLRNGTRECGLTCAEESVTGLRKVSGGEMEDSGAGAVLDGSVEEIPHAAHLDFFDVPGTGSQSLATKNPLRTRREGGDS